MKKEGKRITIIAIIILVIIALALLAYFLFFSKSNLSLDNEAGLSAPDYSAGANIGEVVGNAASSNPYANVKLNPFANGS